MNPIKESTKLLTSATRQLFRNNTSTEETSPAKQLIKMTDSIDFQNNLSDVNGAGIAAGGFRTFFENDKTVPPESKVPYLLMVARGVVDGVPISSNLNETEPFAEELGIKSFFSLPEKRSI